ncbi:Hypothetical protein CM240_0530 [Clostridium bornimense]|uniref:Polymerase nucleotidyl transferase domain-containing protein n=1 Tax=Clostridium bornimense TaxID=1216932 RepID=W6SDG6_9CLOT|nr:nucleotidyltransferase domain-containing protein [Clostridium bornimense]CDM67695.1 Hypothetical protein CM240_0530 [Clostridium bornimense]
MIKEIKKDVSYKLEDEVKSEITKVKNTILDDFNDAYIYIFGSIAKGCYSKVSDIDILVLISIDKSVKEIRQIRHTLEDKIEKLILDREVDLKIYDKDRFYQLSTKPSFESEILDDLIDIRMW